MKLLLPTSPPMAGPQQAPEEEDEEEESPSLPHRPLQHPGSAQGWEQLWRGSKTRQEQRAGEHPNPAPCPTPEHTSPCCSRSPALLCPAGEALMPLSTKQRQLSFYFPPPLLTLDQPALIALDSNCWV